MLHIHVLLSPSSNGCAHYVRVGVGSTLLTRWDPGWRRTPFLVRIGALRLDASRHIHMGFRGAPAPGQTYSYLKTRYSNLSYDVFPALFLRGVRPGDSVPGHPRPNFGARGLGLDRHVLLQRGAAAASCLFLAYSPSCLFLA